MKRVINMPGIRSMEADSTSANQNMSYERLQETLSDCGQEHLLQFWPSLSPEGRQRLSGQLSAVDWSMVESWLDRYVKHQPELNLPSDLRPAPSLPAEPGDDRQRSLYENAIERGRQLLREGRVAGFTVAGGQGTRLGYEGPKGTFPISPVRGKSLFQWFAESLLRAREKYEAAIPWYIMTSPLNDGQTRDFFERNNYFGLPSTEVFLFPQGVMPVIGLDGRFLLSAPDQLAVSPDGHGGSLLALRQSEALADMARRGIDCISYWQIDNPLVHIFDPLFIGMHQQTGSEMSCRGLVKTGPLEKLGNFCLVDGRVSIVEYSDMPERLARMTDEQGRLIFRIGSPAIHLLSRSFVERLTEGGKLALPFHRAVKKVPFVNSDGEQVEPDAPNAVKLETFIFDALPLADQVLILEAVREEQFAPVKNRTGVDSVESCRHLMQERAARWLEAAGIPVPRSEDRGLGCQLELSPRAFLDPDDVRRRASQIQPPQSGNKEYYE